VAGLGPERANLDISSLSIGATGGGKGCIVQWWCPHISGNTHGIVDEDGATP
jgi:hypothetical protein